MRKWGIDCTFCSHQTIFSLLTLFLLIGLGVKRGQRTQALTSVMLTDSRVQSICFWQRASQGRCW